MIKCFKNNTEDKQLNWQLVLNLEVLNVLERLLSTKEIEVHFILFMRIIKMSQGLILTLKRLEKVHNLLRTKCPSY